MLRTEMSQDIGSAQRRLRIDYSPSGNQSEKFASGNGLS